MYMYEKTTARFSHDTAHIDISNCVIKQKKTIFKLPGHPARLRSACTFVQSGFSMLCTKWVHVAKDLSFLHAERENSDQTG